MFCVACNLTKSNTPPWVFFTFFKLYKGRNMWLTASNSKFFMNTKCQMSATNTHIQLP